jgi:O-methyltransferase involved in polyketide biosynthesis
MQSPTKVDPALSGVAETLLIPLYNRALDALRPDAIMQDEQAVKLIARLDYDFSQVRKIRMFAANQAARIILTREIDRFVRGFLSRQPAGVVVHIGCGLDTRFERVDNGQVEWYDLDLPEVIELRRRFLSGDGPRYHLLGCSVLEQGWLAELQGQFPRPGQIHRPGQGTWPVLFVAENVLIYFNAEEVKTLLLRLRERFPGAELVFDGWRPFFIWLGNRQLSGSKFTGLLRWGFWSGKEIEAWGPGIRQLGEWGFFEQPELRLARYRWAAPLFHLLKPLRIFHFLLG